MAAPLWFTGPMQRTWEALEPVVTWGEPEELSSGSAQVTVSDVEELLPARTVTIDVHTGGVTSG